VVARDDASLAAHQALAPAVRGVLSVDVAFALPYEDRSASRGGAKLRVGVNVSSLLYIEAENRTNRFGLDVDYADLMRRFLTDLTADPAVEVHLISHVAGDWVGQDNDGPVAQALAREFPGVVLVPAFKGPSEAKSYISSLDFLVAGRMHACIAAFSSGVPVIPVAYSRKFSGLFGMLGYKWLVPVKGVDTGAALKFLHDGLRDRALLAQDIRDGMMRVGALLDVYRDTLREFFAAARGGR
jgi:polysaccharide pyruvyl transferase WcaK-like protein